MRILYVTTISLTMNSFFKPHVEMLINEGHEVDIACNYKELPLDGLYSELGCHFYLIDFSRSPLSIGNIKAYSQLKNVIQNGNYDIVHCHTPNASVITRLVCRKFRKKNGLKVFYTAHGFHFYKGAPLKNWLMYYPIEKFCSRFTDKLITINQEDYALAQKKFKAKEVCYVPGVGVDLSRFQNVQVDRNVKRHEIGVPENKKWILIVGELIPRKNQETLIRAIVGMDNVYLTIVGKGILSEHLVVLVKELNMMTKIQFLGYRTDISELCNACDIFAFASFHEGLPVAVMEAMASGCPCVVSRIRGNTDLIDDKKGGILFDPYSVEECRKAIQNIITTDKDKMAEYNREKVRKFSQKNVLEIMKKIYENNL